MYTRYSPRDRDNESNLKAPGGIDKLKRSSPIPPAEITRYRADRHARAQWTAVSLRSEIKRDKSRWRAVPGAAGRRAVFALFSGLPVRYCIHCLFVRTESPVVGFILFRPVTCSTHRRDRNDRFGRRAENSFRWISRRGKYCRGRLMFCVEKLCVETYEYWTRFSRWKHYSSVGHTYMYVRVLNTCYIACAHVRSLNSFR